MEKINYEKIVKDNANDFNDTEILTDFVDSYIEADGSNLTDLEDSISEHADGLVPIYYNDIVKEWAENDKAHDLTVDVAGEYDSKGNIYKMMQSDLFFYYQQILDEDYNKLLEFINDIN